MTKWFVYIIECADSRFYTGITSDLDRRMKEHKSGRGARFTSSFGFSKLLYQEPHPNRSQALKREAEIKRWPKAKKLELVQRAFIVKPKLKKKNKISVKVLVSKKVLLSK